MLATAILPLPEALAMAAGVDDDGVDAVFPAAAGGTDADSCSTANVKSKSVPAVDSARAMSSGVLTAVPPILRNRHPIWTPARFSGPSCMLVISSPALPSVWTPSFSPLWREIRMVLEAKLPTREFHCRCPLVLVREAGRFFVVWR